MTATLILAAGAGRRMGGPKALLEVNGETLLHRIASIALEAGCAPVLAVVGPWAVELGGLPVQTLVNPKSDDGLASSIRLGIQALPVAIGGVLLLTVDQPAVDAALLRSLCALAAQSPDLPAACAYSGTLGIPAVLPRRLFPELLALGGDRGAKALLLREATRTLPFPAGAFDLDTPGDLAGFRR